MESFLTFQKPLYRFDIFVSLNRHVCSREVGEEAILLQLDGFQDLGKSIFCLCANHTAHKDGTAKLVTWPHLWLAQDTEKVVSFIPSIGLTPSLMTAYCELSLTTGGHRVRIADSTKININLHFPKASNC